MNQKSKEAVKGSQRSIQILINKYEKNINTALKDELGLTNNDRINWVSPKPPDYKEYRDGAFIRELGFELKKTKLKEFWPRGGPVWDGLGKTQSEKFFLVEAKSHISETVSSPTGATQPALSQILDSLSEVKRYCRSKSPADWSQSFYQYTNRLAHLYLLRKLNKIDAYLIFMYFYNDSEMKSPDSISEWEGAIHLLHSYLGICSSKLNRYIVDVFVDAKTYEATAKIVGSIKC